jgi:Xaa-Pro aminopeptidase
MKLTAEGCRLRRERLIAAAQGVDTIILNNPRHILYFTGLYMTPLALKGAGHNYLLIDCKSGHSTLLAHSFIAEDAMQAVVNDIRIWFYYDAVEDPAAMLYPEGLRQLNRLLAEKSRGVVGAELGLLPYGAAVERVIDLTSVLLQLRRIKDVDELELIRRAIQAVEAGHRAARAIVRPGISEWDAYNAVQSACVQAAQEMVLPMGDFLSGERAAIGSGTPASRILQAGDLMIFDLYPWISGYRADFTATIAVDDSLSPAQAHLERAVHAALQAGEQQLRPGVIAGDVYRAVRSALAEHGLAENFPHHAGHGLGLDHPEAPYFVPNSEEVLLAGDVVTLEPGAYLDDTGARIEHIYRITASGCERLTHHDTAFITKRSPH